MLNQSESTKKTKIVGITGGIGSGKSAVSDILRALGYTVLSADVFAREITTPGSPALAEISQVFGPSSLLPDGTLHRNFLRDAITRNPSLRSKLDSITHPRIQALTQKAWQKLCNTGVPLAFYEAPLLFEARSESKMDKVICVHADDAVRVQRIMNRDGVSMSDAQALLQSQLPQEEKMKRSNYLISNDGSLDDLNHATMKLLESIKTDLQLDHFSNP